MSLKAAREMYLGEHEEIDMSAPGQKFETEITRSLAVLSLFSPRPVFYKRIADTRAKSPTIRCPRCGHVFHSPVVLPPVIADHIVLVENRVIFLEEKSSTRGRFDVVTRIQPDQWFWSLATGELGDAVQYYFLLSDRSDRRRLRTVAIDGLNLLRVVAETGVKSVTLKHIYQSSPPARYVELPHVKGGYWDLSVLWGGPSEGFEDWCRMYHEGEIKHSSITDGWVYEAHKSVMTAVRERRVITPAFDRLAREAQKWLRDG